MKAKRKLLPGQAGTKKLVEKYGKNLVCVRYRYDAENKRRVTTIELIIAEAPWRRKIRKNQIMNVSIKYGEIELGRKVRAAGGNWNREKQVWELPYGMVVKLGLKDRIVTAQGEREVGTVQ